MGKPVVHFEVIGKDAQKLSQFYGQMFEWHIDHNNPMNYGLVDTHADGHGINGGIGAEDSRGVRFYVEVEDLQAYLDRAEKLGGKTIMPPVEIPGAVTMAMFTDPEGNQVGLIKG